MTDKYLKRTEGFTLVELSIVIIIIGFLIAGVAAGQSPIKQAALNSVITEYGGIRLSVNTFKERYGFFPGDFPNAFAYWGASCGANTVGANDSCNGNGDGLFSTDRQITGNNVIEALYAWKHLSLSGLVNGNFVGLIDNIYPPRENAGENVLASKLASGGYSFDGSGSCGQAVWGTFIRCGKNYLTLGTYDSVYTAGYYNGIVTPADGAALDSKIDDGNNFTGTVWILPSNGFAGIDGKCTVSDVYTGTDSSLILTINEPNCRVTFLPAEWQN
jgi:prepilin-type N-terminal cleavage/methylation domain-containing protein